MICFSKECFDHKLIVKQDKGIEEMFKIPCLDTETEEKSQENAPVETPYNGCAEMMLQRMYAIEIINMYDNYGNDEYRFTICGNYIIEDGYAKHKNEERSKSTLMK
jgi:hypothetical protein